jgi:hypothetical protein
MKKIVEDASVGQPGCQNIENNFEKEAQNGTAGQKIGWKSHLSRRINYLLRYFLGGFGTESPLKFMAIVKIPM